MSAAFVLAALASAGLVSWLHLRPRGARAAAGVPSLQHLPGASARRRRTLPLEERASWALVLAGLLLAALALVADRAGGQRAGPALVLVDPAAGTAGWERAAALGPGATLLGFAGEAPRAQGPHAARLALELRDCSDTRPACLLRAAALGPGAPLIAGGFGPGWEPALARFGRPFRFVHLATPAPEAAAVEPGREAERPAPSPASRVNRAGVPPLQVAVRGAGDAALLWTAALAGAAAERGGVEVALERAGGGAGAVVAPLDAPAPASGGLPGAEAAAVDGLLLGDPLALAAGSTALGLRSSLRLLPDARFRPVLGAVAAIGDERGHPLLALAACAADLARLNHQGALAPLARALLAALDPRPISVRAPPPGGAATWRAVGEPGAGSEAAVGLADVAPGRYLRADGRVELSLPRAAETPAAALDDRALASLGGVQQEGAAARVRAATAALWLALLLFGAGAFLGRGARRALPASLAAAALLVALALDAGRPLQAPLQRAALLDVGEGERAGLERALGGAGVSLLDAAALDRCAALEAPAPCRLLARIGLASAPPHGATVLIFDPAQPRVDLTAVRAPAEIPLGAAAAIEATVRVRRGSGKRLVVRTRPSSAPAAEAALVVDGPDVVRTLRLQAAPLAAGVSFAAVEARLDGAGPEATDARVVALSTRAAPLRRLLIAAAPDWEARAAAGALEEAGPGPLASLVQVGATAVLARGPQRLAPRALLASDEALNGLDTLVLVGFTRRDLDGAPLRAVERFAAGGGAVLLLGAGAAGLSPGFPEPAAAATPLLGRLTGRLGPAEPFDFTGYAPAALPALPAGAEVLGTLGPAGQPAAPWVAGRAHGRGRVAAVLAPDLWRLSPPAGRGPAYRAAFLAALGWAEAARAAGGGVALDESWSALERADGRVVPLRWGGAQDAVAGSPAVGAPGPATAPVDPIDPAALTEVARARLRAAAARERVPFLEEDGAAGLAAAWRRLPAAPVIRQQLRLRADDVAFAVLAGLIALESLLRRGGREGRGA